jgi:predicted RNA-binding protein
VEDIRESLDESVEYALKYSDSIVLINLLPHSSAPVMGLWLSGEWNYLTKEEFKGACERWAEDPRVELDEETFNFTPNIGDKHREKIIGVGEWQLTHPHYEVWHDYIIRWYRPPSDRILIFLPCTKQKPYSNSKTHMLIIEELKKIGRTSYHEVMLSSAGLIPREFEMKYPFTDYDWDERLEGEAIKRRYIEVTAKRISEYLKVHQSRYRKVVCYLKHDSESYIALERACKEHNLICTNLLDRKVYDNIGEKPSPLRSDEAIKSLSEGLRWCLQDST